MKYFRNTSWLFAEKILRMGVGLFVGIWIAKVLGPEEYGNLNYIQSFVGLFSAFTTLGISGIVIREIVREPKNEDKVLVNAFVLRGFGALVTVTIIYFVLFFLPQDDGIRNLIFLAAIGLFFHAFNVVDLYFQAHQLNKYSAIANIGMLVASAIFKLSLIMLHAPLSAYVWALLFDGAILSLNFLILYMKVANKKLFSIMQMMKKVDLSNIVQLFRQSAPLFLSTLIISIYSQLDQVMLKYMTDAEMVGQYAAAVRLNSMWALLPSVVLVVATPMLMSSRERGRDEVNSSYERIYKLLSFYSFVILAMTWLFGGAVVEATFGKVYAPATSIWGILVLANLFSYLGAASSRWFINEKLEKKILYRNLLGVSCNIVGNILLIPRFGAQGAAFTTLFAQFMANFFYDVIDKEARILFYQKASALLFVFSPWQWRYEILKFRNSS